MAKQEKPEKKVSKVMEILRTEYPFEGILLGVLGLLVLLLGVYIYEARVLEITMTDWWIFNTEAKIVMFSIIIMLIGLGALVYAFGPFVVPGFKEMNRVSWPTRNTMVNHSSRVLGFIAFLGFMFIIYDLIFVRLFGWILGT